AFNVLPAYPMDGGRVLRSVIWAITRSQSKGTVAAARVGQLFGMGFLAYGIARGVVQQDFRFLWLATIGFLLLQAATATLTQQRRTRVLAETRAAALMRPPPTAIPADTPVGRVREAYVHGRAGAFPVLEDGG